MVNSQPIFDQKTENEERKQSEEGKELWEMCLSNLEAKYNSYNNDPDLELLEDKPKSIRQPT